LHSSSEDLKRYALGQVPSNEASAIETHLLECPTCRKAFAALALGPRGAMGERRSEVRLTLNSPARIKALDPLTSLGPSTTGEVLDSSDTGLKLKVPRAFFSGAVVQIRFQDQIVLGTVRYCIPSGDEFHIGVHLKENL
jgi:hypothetical protein